MTAILNVIPNLKIPIFWYTHIIINHSTRTTWKIQCVRTTNNNKNNFFYFVFIYIKDKTIQTQNSIKHLGLHLNKRLSWAINIKNKRSSISLKRHEFKHFLRSNISALLSKFSSINRSSDSLWPKEFDSGEQQKNRTQINSKLFNR